MPGFVIHIAVAQEYLKKHNKSFSVEFILGSIEPDFTDNKSETHYGKSSSSTNLKKYLSKNKICTDFERGYFLHLITDYLFYNHYLDKFEKPQIYYDYDFTNKAIVEKYNLFLPDKTKNKIHFENGTPKILTLQLAYKIIDEISDLDIENIEKEVLSNSPKWNYYNNSNTLTTKYGYTYEQYLAEIAGQV